PADDPGAGLQHLPGVAAAAGPEALPAGGPVRFRLPTVAEQAPPGGPLGMAAVGGGAVHVSLAGLKARLKARGPPMKIGLLVGRDGAVPPATPVEVQRPTARALPVDQQGDA